MLVLLKKITSGTKAHSSLLLPDKLAQNIPNISLVGVLSLGCECILDVFPRNQGTSITNEVLAGRAMLTDGSLTLMSGEASMSLKLYTSHELSQNECSYCIILLALPTPNIDENIVHHNLSNLIRYRMAQVNVYHTIIKENLGTKNLNNILSLFGESTTDFDTKEDKITRIITLLQTPNHPQPIEAIELVISKMLGSDVKSELQALKQSSVGTVSLCKKRLASVLSLESGGEEESSFNFSLNSTAESVKEESSLPSSLPPSHFFLKDKSCITGSRKKRRPDELNPTFHNISDYLAGLDNIKESKLN